MLDIDLPEPSVTLIKEVGDSGVNEYQMASSSMLDIDLPEPTVVLK